MKLLVDPNFYVLAVMCHKHVYHVQINVLTERARRNSDDRSVTGEQPQAKVAFNVG